MQRTVKRPERKVFGKYTLIGKLAKGGMGAIYLARLEGVAGFEKIVVIKRILPHLADRDRYIHMLLDEARIAARLSHPNICQVHELDEVDGEYYIAMEYLEGVSLSELLRRMAKAKLVLDPRIVAAIITQACEGLHAAHELVDRNGAPTNLVHRDVSPSNVFITAAGPVKILDFGIAKTPDKLANTRTGAIKGKWAYMSPEQIMRQPLDRRSDIFSLGVVTFEALTAKRLFRRDSEYEICRAITEANAPSVRNHRPELPGVLAEVVARALDRDKGRRFATASEMSKALNRAVAGLGGPATLSEIAEFVTGHFALELAERRQFVRSVDAPRPIDAVLDSGPIPIAPELYTDTSVASGSGSDGVVISFESDVQSVPGGARGRLQSRPSIRTPLRSLRAPTAPTEALHGSELPALPGPSGSESPDAPAPEPGSERDEYAQLVVQLGDVPSLARKSPRWRLWIAALGIIALGASAAYAYIQQDRAETPAVAARVDVESGSLQHEGDHQGEHTTADREAAMAGDDSGDAPDPGATGQDGDPPDDPVTNPEGERDSDRTSKRSESRRLVAMRKRDPGKFYPTLVSRRGSALRRCFEDHMTDDLPEVLTLVMKIDRRGRVKSAGVEPRAHDRQPVGRCVSRVVKAIDFGKHENSLTTVRVPLRTSMRRTR